MKRKITRMLMPACLVLILSVHFSTAAGSSQPLFHRWGNWEVGLHLYRTIFTPSGPVPAASVGHFTEDASGNLTAVRRGVWPGVRRRRHCWNDQCEPRLHGDSDPQCSM